MNFTQTKLAGAYVVTLELRADERGFFARVWCTNEFKDNGLNPNLVQSSISFNAKRGTLRGMHWQNEPFAEAKIVRCTMGSIFDVIIDLRENSPTYKEHFGINLTSENRTMLYIPVGFAHGFFTLSDNTELQYQMSEFYHPECQRGLRWNDPAFAITWPETVNIISERDNSYPDFDR
ncbi:MAG: dTDP-4-dehydrorhamnose 3,5-epimerase [candidate division Zixibacteria bacterium]|nr:dTDP-4-dehydrorhamnose 3,5-epimerase [candidate division Zixibacteria bacterium]